MSIGVNFFIRVNFLGIILLSVLACAVLFPVVRDTSISSYLFVV